MKNSGETRLVVKRNHGKGGTCYLSGLSPQDLSEIPEYRLDLPFWNPWDLTASHSCSGGLLSMTSFAGHIYLCNPTTKQFQILPPKEETRETPDGILSLSETRIVGSCVGYDSESDDYRVLRVWEREHRLGIGQPSEKHRTYDLYSLRDDSWKPIPPPECHCRLPTMTPTIIYARDKFYWPTLDQEVMCYDCREESFYLLPSPPNTRGLCLQPVKFYDEDSLGAVLYRSPKVNPETGLAQPDAYFELWKWGDGARCWDRVFNVSLGGWIHGTEGSIYGQFVFVCGAAGPLTDVKQRLVAYDWCKKECKELGIHNFDIGIDVFCYVESDVALPHGRPIYGSHIIDYGYFDKDEEATTYHDEILQWKADLKDFEDNGFRIIDEKEAEEEEEREVGRITNHAPNDGYGQSPIYEYNPYIPNYGYVQPPCYIPGARIGADGSMISFLDDGSMIGFPAPQHDYTLPFTWASYPPLIFHTWPAAHNTPTSSGCNSSTSQAAPIPQIRGPQVFLD